MRVAMEIMLGSRVDQRECPCCYGNEMNEQYMSDCLSLD